MGELRLVRLERGHQRATIAPEIGGSLAAYEIAFDGMKIDLVRPCPASGPGSTALDLACFPLVPYSSRIRNGVFRFQGREIHLPLNFGAHPHSIHGHGWQAPWSVVAQDSEAVTLDYCHDSDSWPWAYRARQRYALDENGLLIELSATNLALEAMPVGLGLHPYFPRARQARLRANVASVWQMDAEIMPIALTPLPPDCRLPEGVALANVVLDNGFEGWDGTAWIEWPTQGIGLDLAASPALGRLVVYAPEGQDFFCVEPVSNMTDAFNRAAGGERDTGMRVLAPGETLSVWMRLAPRHI